MKKIKIETRHKTRLRLEINLDSIGFLLYLDFNEIYMKRE